MNSTTLPPLKPRTNKLYASTGGINTNTSATNLNATIATSGVRNGRNSSSSNGIQVQQLYDSTLHKSYLNHSHQHHHNNNHHHSNHHNHSLNTTNHKDSQEKHGAKSPSADSLNSNKSTLYKTNANNNNNNSQLNANSSLSIQQHLNSTNMRRNAQPMTPETAMKNYMQKLTSIEHHEIFNYPEIYFLGQNAKKIHGVIGGPNNNGYDDENGSYKPVQHDHILYRFEILKILGRTFFYFLNKKGGLLNDEFERFFFVKNLNFIYLTF